MIINGAAATFKKWDKVEFLQAQLNRDNLHGFLPVSRFCYWKKNNTPRNPNLNPSNNHARYTPNLLPDLDSSSSIPTCKFVKKGYQYGKYSYTVNPHITHFYCDNTYSNMCTLTGPTSTNNNYLLKEVSIYTGQTNSGDNLTINGVFPKLKNLFIRTAKVTSTLKLSLGSDELETLYIPCELSSISDGTSSQPYRELPKLKNVYMEDWSYPKALRFIQTYCPNLEHIYINQTRATYSSNTSGNRSSFMNDNSTDAVYVKSKMIFKYEDGWNNRPRAVTYTTPKSFIQRDKGNILCTNYYEVFDEDLTQTQQAQDPIYLYLARGVASGESWITKAFGHGFEINDDLLTQINTTPAKLPTRAFSIVTSSSTTPTAHAANDGIDLQSVNSLPSVALATGSNQCAYICIPNLGANASVDTLNNGTYNGVFYKLPNKAFTVANPPTGYTNGAVVDFSDIFPRRVLKAVGGNIRTVYYKNCSGFNNPTAFSNTANTNPRIYVDNEAVSYLTGTKFSNVGATTLLYLDAPRATVEATTGYDLGFKNDATTLQYIICNDDPDWKSYATLRAEDATYLLNCGVPRIVLEHNGFLEPEVTT